MGCKFTVGIKIPISMQKHGAQHNRGHIHIPDCEVSVLKT